MSARTPKFDPETVPFLALPWMLFSQRNNLPKRAAVYFICDGNGKVLYIGQSINIRQRWTTHERITQCGELSYCRIAWLDIEDHTLLTLIEDACIDYFSPPWNGDGGGYLDDQRKNLKVSYEVWRLLRQIAAATDQKYGAVLERLLVMEWQRLRPEHTTPQKGS